MAQRLDGPAMEFPADNCPDRCGKREQQVILAGKRVHEEHAEDHDRYSEDTPQDEQIAFAGYLRLPAFALLIHL